MRGMYDLSSGQAGGKVKEGTNVLAGLHRVAPARAVDHQPAKITAVRKLADKLHNFLTSAVRCDLGVRLMDTMRIYVL